jgi:hypothetical protein
MLSYYITAVEKDNNGRIQRILIHTPLSAGILSKGSIVTESAAISMYNRGDRFATSNWNYFDAKWKEGQAVEPVRNGQSYYLRSVLDKKVTNNLDNLLPLSAFY